MYCKNCGSKLNDTDKFCSYCGTLVDNTVKATVMESNNQVGTQQTQPGLGLGIAGCILGPVGFFLQLIPVVPFFLVSVTGIILSAVGLNKGRVAKKETGQKAVGSIVTNSIGLGLSIYMSLMAVFLFFLYSNLIWS